MAPIWGAALLTFWAIFQLSCTTPSYGQPSYGPPSYGPSQASYAEPTRPGTPYLHCAHSEVPKGNDYYSAPELLDDYSDSE